MLAQDALNKNPHASASAVHACPVDADIRLQVREQFVRDDLQIIVAEKLDRKVLTPDEPQLVGALGAALLAGEAG